MQWQSEGMRSSGIRAELAPTILEALVSHSLESVMITAADGASSSEHWPIVYVNPAFEQMTGFKSAEVLGKSPRRLQGPATDPEVLKQLDEDIAAGRTFRGHTVNYRKDGSEFTIEWTVLPVENEAGEVEQYLAVQRDMSASDTTDAASS